MKGAVGTLPPTLIRALGDRILGPRQISPSTDDLLSLRQFGLASCNLSALMRSTSNCEFDTNA